MNKKIAEEEKKKARENHNPSKLPHPFPMAEVKKNMILPGIG